MENKTIFDTWMETNSKFMNNWLTSTQKLQEAVTSGHAIEKGSEIYQEWLNNQSEIAKESAATGKTTFETIYSNPFATNGATNGAAASFNPADVYTQWMNAQQNAMKQFMDNAKNFTTPFAAGNDMFANVRNAQEQMMSQANTWMTQWTAPFSAMSKNINDGTARDAYQQMLNMSNTYFKMYEVWAPMYKQMTANTFNAEQFKDLFNTEKFKNLLDKSFEFTSPVQLKELYTQFNNWFEVINNYNRHAFQTASANMPQQMQQLMPFLMFGNNNANGNDIAGFYQRAMNPLVRLFAPGKESEMNELYSELLNKIGTYGNKLNELQYLLYNTGTKNFETFAFESYEDVKKGADLSNFQQVFQNWVNKNEEAFLSLYRTEAYSKLQGELLDLGLEIKGNFEKIAESALQPLPVMLRSEADELHKTIYDLKKRLRELEKANGAAEELFTDEPEVKTAKTSKKKSATA